MRSGHRPRRGPAAVQAPLSLQPVAADDQPGVQLPLESLEEPAEILVRFSTNELDAAAEPPAEGEAVAEPSAESGAAEPSDATTADFSAGPSVDELAASGSVEDASLLMRLARIHLRTGSLTTARAQLESLAVRDLLDTAGTLDLAEARWRTGDLHGAGQVAGAYLAANGGEALGFLIAAEAASLGNHDVEARLHMEQAMMRTLVSLDSVFAGIPHRSMLTESRWEATVAPVKTPVAESPKATAPAAEPATEPAAELGAAAEPAAEPAAELGAAAEPAAEPAAELGAAAEAGAIEATAEAEPELAPTVVVPEVAGTSTTELSTPDVTTQAVVDSSRVQADTEIAAGIALLETGDVLLAALHFGVALRITPESALAVLGAIGDRHDLALELVRGDALRMQGHESDADQAYLSVASALRGARTTAEPPAEVAVETPRTPAEPPGNLSVDAAAEEPAEPAAANSTDARQEAEGPEPRPPEPAPPISWLD